MAPPQKIVIVGAGPVGSLAALYAAQRDYEVELYELRPERGINAMRHAGQPGLLDHVMAATIPMRGRMVHGRDKTGSLYEHAQDYDARGRVGKCTPGRICAETDMEFKAIYAIDRGGLNKRLLDILDSLPNVKLLFNHKLTGADFRSRKAWFEVRDQISPKNGRPKEIEIDFDLMIGADGAHSAVRYHLMKFSRMDYQQEYIDTLWCEFHIPPQKTVADSKLASKFRISPYHLHIWPGKEFMFIAIPSEDGSFTCTLFLPSKEISHLESNPPSLPKFFDYHFPGVTDLIPADSLIASFESNPHLPLISIKCRPYHHGASGVVIGDAAHAMVPFYGQGMNAGMEDVRILFSILDKHAKMDETNSPDGEAEGAATPFLQRMQALAEYSAVRAPDAHAINDLALQNYVEMRSSVLSMRYRLRKYLEEFASVHFPNLGWQTKYARVSFGNEGYADVVRKSDYQGKVLVQSFMTLLGSPVVGIILISAYKYRRPLCSILQNLAGLARK